MLKVAIISNSFPYCVSGEEFLSDELSCWNNQKALSIDIIVLNPKTDVPRKVDLKKGRIWRLEKRSFVLLLATRSLELFKSRFFGAEIRKLFFKPIKLIYSFLYGLRILDYQLQLDELIRKQKLDYDLIYSYWFSYGIYAAVLLKNKYKWKVVTRAHGYDLYSERFILGYEPYRLFFFNKIDLVATVSRNGSKYLSKRFDSSGNIEVHYLGTEVHHILSKNDNNNTLSIISCSSLIPLKRVDVILDAMVIMKERNRCLKLKWIHFGAGKGKKRIHKKAEMELYGKADYTFAGYKDKKDVLNYYSEHPIDLFINASSTEGLPVSIIESISFGVPVIAPDVGGISEIVRDGRTGILLKGNYSAEDLANALMQFLEHNKMKSLKRDIQEFHQTTFNKERNYKRFIERLLKLCI